MDSSINGGSNPCLLNNELIFNRVEQLKKFSQELQALVYDELAFIYDDMLRIRRLVGESVDDLQLSFQSIHHMSNDMQSLCAKIESLSSPSHPNNQQQSLHDLGQLIASYDSDDVKKNISIAIQALQFEDIVGQVTERVAQQISNVRDVVNILSHVHDSEFSQTFEVDLEEKKQLLSDMRQKLSQTTASCIAAQQTMDDGDIDLF